SRVTLTPLRSVPLPKPYTAARFRPSKPAERSKITPVNLDRAADPDGRFQCTRCCRNHAARQGTDQIEETESRSEAVRGNLTQCRHGFESKMPRPIPNAAMPQHKTATDPYTPRRTETVRRAPAPPLTAASARVRRIWPSGRPAIR